MKPDPKTPLAQGGTDLSQFDSTLGLDRGKPKWFELLWYLVKCVFFLSALPWPNKLKMVLLKTFGAKIGKGVVIKPRVNIHLPWKLEIGDHTWLGEEVFILNFEPTKIGSNCCISQRAFLCCGNHDFRSPDFRYRNRPITVEDGAWVGAACFVGPGVTVHEEAVLTACSVATKDLPRNMICTGNPAVPVKQRWPDAP